MRQIIHVIYHELKFFLPSTNSLRLFSTFSARSEGGDGRIGGKENDYQANSMMSLNFRRRARADEIEAPMIGPRSNNRTVE